MQFFFIVCFNFFLFEVKYHYTNLFFFRKLLFYFSMSIGRRRRLEKEEGWAFGSWLGAGDDLTERPKKLGAYQIIVPVTIFMQYVYNSYHCLKIALLYVYFCIVWKVAIIMQIVCNFLSLFVLCVFFSFFGCKYDRGQALCGCSNFEEALPTVMMFWSFNQRDRNRVASRPTCKASLCVYVLLGTTMGAGQCRVIVLISVRKSKSSKREKGIGQLAWRFLVGVVGVHGFHLLSTR